MAYLTPWHYPKVSTLAGRTHPTQQVKREMDNALCLTLPVTDFREIKREILKYGAQMEVISPEELREEVKEEIRKMENIYS
jgi:predicted DNA-binding transcriptional regulator YafY